MPEKIRLIAEHYNVTAQATFHLWRQRNTTFIVLVAVIGVALLLTHSPRLIAEVFSGTLSVDGGERRAIRDGFPYAILQVGLSVMVFYLMVSLYHRHTSIVRNYAYLGLVEAEIRRDLGLDEKDIAFSRESSFYFANQSLILRIMKLFYSIILGGLLAAYFGYRIWSDLENANAALLAADGAVAVATSAVFLGYVTLRKPKRARMGG